MTQEITGNGSGSREVAASRHLIGSEDFDQKVACTGGDAVEFLLAAGAEHFAENVMVHLREIKNGESVCYGGSADLVAGVKRSLVPVREVPQKGCPVVAA
jgi:hypothetical protein